MKLNALKRRPRSGLKTGEVKLSGSSGRFRPKSRTKSNRFVSETSASGSDALGKTFRADKSRPDASATSTASSSQGKPLAIARPPSCPGLTSTRSGCEAWRMVKNCVRVRDKSQPDSSDWFSVQSTASGARLDRWREHRVDGRFRGKLHAARRRQPGKKSQTRDRHRPMPLLVEHCQAAYPRSDAKPVRGDRISNQQHTRHKSQGWHRNEEQP